MRDVTLNQQEQARIQVLNSVLEHHLRIARAAGIMVVSERHTKRLLAAYRKDGPAALAHGNRGRRPRNAIPETAAAAVVRLASNGYSGANHTHLTELLREREGIDLSRPTVRRILVKAGIGSPRSRRSPQHRFRRRRLPQEGMLVEGQDKCPSNCSAEMSFAWSVMISDGVSAEVAGDRRVGGLPASMYLLTVSRWIPSSLAIPRMDSPLSFASCTAFQLSLWRKVGFRGDAATVMAARTSAPMTGSYSFASSILISRSSGTVAGESAGLLGSGRGRQHCSKALYRLGAPSDLVVPLERQ